MRFSLSDILVTGVVAVLSAGLLVVFFNDLNAISSHENQTPMGTIFFKKQTATRKSAESQVWERLRSQSPVFEDDTLHTDEDSEAVVNFDDGLSLDMLQNSMLKLTTHGASASLDFQEGSITLHGGPKGAPVLLGQNGRSVALSSDAQLVVTKTKGTMSLELSQGTAQVSDSSGQRQTITPETALELSDQGAARLKPVDLIPQSPEQGARLLWLTEGKIPVRFVYKAAKAALAGVQIQLASNSEFTDARSVEAKDGSAQAELEAGTWYWRLAAGGTNSSVRQFTLSREQPLNLIEPNNGAEVSFRKKQPPVRFSWTAGDHVAFWDLEVSANPGFDKPALRRRSTVSSLSVDNLGAGTWYWRVIPRYSGTIVGTNPAPAVGRFTITQKAQMAAVNLTLPVEGTFIQIQELTTKGVAFTWDPPAEAQRYELSVARSPEGAAFARFEATAPYRVVTPQELGPLAAVGKTYWTLQWFDAEGNASAAGPRRTLAVVDAEQALRPTFPPDGYQVADQFLAGIRFSWKSNLSARTVFQASRTPDFKELAAEMPVKTDTWMGAAWPAGTYYWRLTSYNADGSVFLQTPPRRLDVVPPFPKVTLQEPQPGRSFLLPEHQDFTLVWPAVPGADEYSLTLLLDSGSALAGKAVFQASVPAAPGPERFLVPLSRLPEGSYVARLQAFARETPLSTSVIGLYGDSSFSFRRLIRIKLISPDNGAQIDGLTARRQGVKLVWDTVNLPPEATLRLTGEKGTQSFPVREVAPVKLPELKAGRYRWTVEGAIETFDVSSRPPFWFTVLPIPRLPAADGQSPADQTTYSAKDLKGKKTLEFSWNPVPGAQRYRFTLTAEGDGSPIVEKFTQDPQAQLDSLGVLHRGSFLWQVEAQTLGPDGRVEQEGESAQARFVVNLPVLTAPKLPEGQAYYGR